jgi:glutathione S-transferase
MKVRIVLAEKELDYEYVTIDLKSGQHRQPEFLKLNPFGKVPVLVEDDDNLVIYDSTIINEFLDDEYPVPQLRPDDSALRARARILEDYADTAFSLPAMALDRELAKPAGERDEKRVAAARDALEKSLAMLDTALDGNEFLTGDFGLADVAFAPCALQLTRLGVTPGPGLRNVGAWIARLGARASVGTVLKLVA